LNSLHFPFILLLVSGILSGTYILFLLVTIVLYKKERPGFTGTPIEGVSVIIAAHNELNHLKRYLPEILAQNYPLFEVIISCDRCTDGSVEYLKSFSNPLLKIIDTSETPAGFTSKKYALHKAISEASYPWILLTDADCHPSGNQWIRGMMAAKGDKHICLGLSFLTGRKSILNTFVRFETLFTAMQYTAWAICGKPYMAVGRNLLYAKELFINNSGFDKYSKHLGGDDDLLIQSISDRFNTNVCLNTNAFTYSPSPEGFSKWWRQKHRHLNAGKQYPLNVLIGLSIYPFSGLIFYLLCLVYINSPEIPIVIALYILRTCIFIITFAGVSQKWKYSIFWPLLPVLEISYLFYLIFAGLYNLAVPVKKWM